MFLTCMLALIFQVSAGAAGHPDFSGSWDCRSLDGFGYSDPVESQLANRAAQARTLVIKQSAHELSVTRTEAGKPATDKYTLGGKGENVAVWDGKKLVLPRTIELTLSNKPMKVAAEEVWSLSDDTRTLTVDLTVKTPLEKHFIRMVYGRRSEIFIRTSPNRPASE